MNILKKFSRNGKFLNIFFWVFITPSPHKILIILFVLPGPKWGRRVTSVSVSDKLFPLFPFSKNVLFIYSSGRGQPVSPAVSNRTPLSRNVPSRSTFHSGQTRQRNHTSGYGPASGLQTQDTSAIAHAARTSSFFSKLSSRFSKR